MTLTITDANARRLLAWYASRGMGYPVQGTLGTARGDLPTFAALTIGITLRYTPPGYRKGGKRSGKPIIVAWLEYLALCNEIQEEIGRQRIKRNGATSHREYDAAVKRLEELDKLADLAFENLRVVEDDVLDAAISWFAEDLTMRIARSSPVEQSLWETRLSA